MSQGGSKANSEVISSYLIVHNVSKKHNIGGLARTAAAFGVKEFCLVGSNKFNTFGSHGAASHIHFKHFVTLPECVKYLKEKGCEIIGIEIDEKAVAIQSYHFNTSAAFIVGNEGSGLSEIQKRCCEKYVYIPQYGNGTASLNVTVAASIALHHFATNVGFSETERSGQKFLVSEKPVRKNPKGVVSDECPEDVREMREKRRQEDSSGYFLSGYESDDGGNSEKGQNNSAKGYFDNLLFS